MTYIIVDALDECPDTSGVVSLRERVLEVVEELVDLHLPNLRLYFTSRPEADIRDYVKSVVHSDRKMRRWRVEDRELVIDMLVRKADGM